MSKTKRHHRRISWIDRDFHAFCVIIYVVICLFDFLIFPLYFEYRNSELTPDRQAAIAETFKDSPAQVQVFVALRQERSWHPITLESSGLFHVAFGAVLGVGIWARGRSSNIPLQTMLTNGGLQPVAPIVTPSLVVSRRPTVGGSRPDITPPDQPDV